VYTELYENIEVLSENCQIIGLMVTLKYPWIMDVLKGEMMMNIPRNMRLRLRDDRIDDEESIYPNL
jgi:hypothetical protein